jgi:hypothetical protein
VPLDGGATIEVVIGEVYKETKYFFEKKLL